MFPGFETILATVGTNVLSDMFKPKRSASDIYGKYASELQKPLDIDVDKAPQVRSLDRQITRTGQTAGQQALGGLFRSGFGRSTFAPGVQSTASAQATAPMVAQRGDVVQNLINTAEAKRQSALQALLAGDMIDFQNQMDEYAALKGGIMTGLTKELGGLGGMFGQSNQSMPGRGVGGYLPDYTPKVNLPIPGQGVGGYFPDYVPKVNI